MSKSESSKGIIWTLTLVLSALAIVYFGTYAYGIFCERNELSDRADSLELFVENLRNDNAYKREFLNRLATDDDFAKRVVRETLGYVGEREIVFKFDEKNFSPKTGQGVTIEKSRRNQ